MVGFPSTKDEDLQKGEGLSFGCWKPWLCELLVVFQAFWPYYSRPFRDFFSRGGNFRSEPSAQEGKHIFFLKASWFFMVTEKPEQFFFSGFWTRNIGRALLIALVPQPGDLQSRHASRIFFVAGAQLTSAGGVQCMAFL